MIEVINRWTEIPGNEWDCCIFAGELIESVRGYNPASEWTVKGREDAQGVLDRESLESIACRKFGAPISPEGAEDGDFALVNIRKGEMAAVVYRNGLVVRTPYGVGHFNLRHAAHIWRT